MIAKTAQKLQAIELRKEGLSYSEILKIVPVAKSSLSLWLHGINLEKQWVLRLKEKLKIAQKLGAIAKRKQRIDKTRIIKEDASSQITSVSDRELFYMGLMLYWAEGTKQRAGNEGQGVSFSNSDPAMCKLFLKWIRNSLFVSSDRIKLRIYIHESQKNRVKNALSFWSKIVGFSEEVFSRTCFTITRYPRKDKRVDSGKYYGQLRIDIRKSTDLNRKISGWTEGICLKCGVASQNKL